LRVRANRSQFGLNASHCAEELFGGNGATLDLCEGFMKDLSDIEETNNISFFITDRLQIKRVLNF
jgi:hypothetical protein